MAINKHNAHDRRGAAAGDGISNPKNNREAQSGGAGGDNKASGNFGKWKSGGASGGFGQGFRSNGNSNDDMDKGNTDDSNSSNYNNDGNGNDNGSSNNNGNGNGNDGGSAATTASSSGGDDSNDSNGTQQFSSESVDDTTTTTDAPTPAATMPPTTVVLTTSTIVTTGPFTVVTSFIPLITTATTVESTASLHTPLSPFGPSGTGFPDFPTFSWPTGKDRSSSDDKTHKGVNGTTTDDSNSSSSSSNNSKGNDNNKGSNNIKNSSKSLDPTAKRALISVGSIGAFVVACFIFWLVWRAFKKQKQKKLQQGSVSTFPSHDGPFTAISRLPGRVYNHVVNKIPFASKQRKAWQTLEETSSTNAAPMMAKNIGRSQMPWAGGPAFEEKGGDTLRTFGFESDLPPAIPSQVYYSSGLGLGLKFQSPAQQTDANSMSRMPAPGLMRSNSAVSELTRSPAASFSASMASVQSGMPGVVSYGANNVMPGNLGQPTGPGMVVSGAGQQYMTDDMSSLTSTMRSRMPDPFYNQSQLARQPSDAYDPTRRQVNRVSELSSLSSGFGDGEILILPPNQQQAQATRTTMAIPRAPPPIPSGPPPVASSGAAGRFSWMRKQRMSLETVCTDSSEDQPSRFRSVNSWVNQQSGRVRRGQASIDTTTSASAGVAGRGNAAVVPGDQPGVPHPMPEEQRLTMMMDDEEVPRHPDTVPSIRRR